MSDLKTRIGDMRRKLRSVHRHGAGGFTLSRRLSNFWDRNLKSLYDAAGKTTGDLCLLVTGSLGRRQLSPWSDIDFILLGPEGIEDESLEPVAESLCYPLWDAGVKTGQRVHTLRSCRAEAQKDPELFTAILDARCIAGDAALGDSLLEIVDELLENDRLQFNIKRSAEFPVSAQYPPTVHTLEPNTKESPGGLRDYQVAIWNAQRFFGRQGYEKKLVELGIITKIGWMELQTAVDLLLRLRHELHFRARGVEDKLLTAILPEAAILLGYQGAGEAAAAKALLNDYFDAANRVFRFSGRIRDFATSSESAPREDIALGATAGGGMLRLPDSVDFGVRGEKIFEVFSRLAGTSLTLAERTRSRLSSLAALVDDEFRENEGNARAFMELLKKDHVVDSLRALNSIGVLGAYIPPFGALRGLVPYDVFHSYPADEHTLLALDFLDRLVAGAGPERLVETASQFGPIELLRMAILLHDTGKVGGPGHKERSARMAPVVCMRLGLDKRRTHFITQLVGEHEALSHIAHTRDVDDPGVIRELAEKIDDLESLKALFLLTYCDMKAVGPGVWTSWRAKLIEVLYERTLSFLTIGEMNLNQDQMISDVQKAVSGLAPEAQVSSYLEQMKSLRPSWLSPSLAKKHITALNKFKKNKKPLIEIDWEEGEETGEAVLCALDTRGLFAKAAGVFSLERLNILGTQTLSTGEGIVIDTFQFAPRDDRVPKNKMASKLTRRLRQVISKESDIAGLMESAKKISLRGAAPFHVATEIRIDNHCSETQTVVEVWTADRTGLLYTITQALYDFDLAITSAKINTIAGRAIDSFYVVDESGGKIAGLRARKLRAFVHEALQADGRAKSPKGD